MKTYTVAPQQMHHAHRFCVEIRNDPTNAKTYNKTYATNEDSDQSAQLDQSFLGHMYLLQPLGYPKIN